MKETWNDSYNNIKSTHCLDALVYELYCLSEEEIKIVENQN